MGLRRWFIVARRIFLGLGLLIVLLSIGLRVRTYLLTREIYVVLAGLERVQIDKTSEAELPTMVPYLAFAFSGKDGERIYQVKIANNYVPSIARIYGIWPTGFDEWNVTSLVVKAASALGWRNLSFGASVNVLNGTVSGLGYGFEPDVPHGIPPDILIAVRSTHGIWISSWRAIPVPSFDDESPDFRFGTGGAFSWVPGVDTIGVAFTPQAPPGSVSHAFQLDLICFWGIRGCDSARNLAPVLWLDRKTIEEAAEARLKSQDPCPDWVLTGRVRTLPDINVALLEVVKSTTERFNNHGVPDDIVVVDFQLKEAIRGEPKGPWTNLRFRQSNSSTAPPDQIYNPMKFNPKPGDRFLYFSGANFGSCRIVPDAPSAESAVRSAIPAPRRSEDDIRSMFGRL
jgi:hypothetical protein